MNVRPFDEIKTLDKNEFIIPYYPIKDVAGQVPVTPAPAQKTPGFEAIFAGIVVLMALAIRRNLYKRLR